MDKLFRAIAKWLYQCGKSNAAMASFLGSYDALVPHQLRKQDEK